MTAFVLDASVTMRWLLETQKREDQAYAWRVLEGLREHEALVPELWHLEVSNVLLSAEKDGMITPSDTDRFIQQLEGLPIQVDAETALHAFTHSTSIARKCGLSTHDAAYLELAVRNGLPIATLDRKVRRAAAKFELTPLFDR